MAAITDERPIPTGEGLTFEKVWAMFQESDRKFQDSDRKFQEQMQEADQKFREEMQEADRKFREEMQEIAKEQKETSRIVKETSRQMGLLNNRFGEVVEHMVVPGIVEKFNEQGYDFETFCERKKYRDPQTSKIKTEIDLLLENGDVVVAVEVKSKPNTEDVDDMIGKMEVLRSYADRKKDARKYRGAIASAVISESVRKYILKNGFYSIEQSGDTMTFNIPEGFTPREW